MTIFAIGERPPSDAEIGFANDLARQQLLGSAALADGAGLEMFGWFFDQGAMRWEEEMRQMELFVEDITRPSAEWHAAYATSPYSRQDRSASCAAGWAGPGVARAGAGSTRGDEAIFYAPAASNSRAGLDPVGNPLMELTPATARARVAARRCVSGLTRSGISPP
jgi:hypothetical protein